MSDEMTVHEVLVGARNLIDREGWGTGPDAMGLCGPPCAMGAIGRTIGATVRSSGYLSHGEVWASGAGQELARVLGVDHRDAMWDWNDRCAKNKDDVLAAFDRAIAATAPAPDLQLTTPGPTSHCPVGGRSHRGPEPKVEAVR